MIYRAKKHCVWNNRLFYPGETVEADECPNEHFESTVPEVPKVVDLADDPGAGGNDDPGEDPGGEDPGDDGQGEADDLSKMTVDKLKELAAAKGIELPANANKAVILGILMQ